MISALIPGIEAIASERAVLPEAVGPVIAKTVLGFNRMIKT
jgi:molybdopterin biosynthesis enzyme MoaB